MHLLTQGVEMDKESPEGGKRKEKAGREKFEIVFDLTIGQRKAFNECFFQKASLSLG